MPRSSRLQIAGAIYHLTARGNRRQPIFQDDRDRTCFFGVLTDMIRRFSWRCHGYCLMPNHYHLLLETPGTDLSAGMQRLNGIYAQWFNDSHGLDGHLFQGRFHSLMVDGEAHLLELARYVVLNPVRARLCSHPSAWPWSSYRAMLGDSAQPFLTTTWLLARFGSEPDRARDRYERFVLDGAGLPGHVWGLTPGVSARGRA